MPAPVPLPRGQPAALVLPPHLLLQDSHLLHQPFILLHPALDTHNNRRPFHSPGARVLLSPPRTVGGIDRVDSAVKPLLPLS